MRKSINAFVRHPKAKGQTLRRFFIWLLLLIRFNVWYKDNADDTAAIYISAAGQAVSACEDIGPATVQAKEYFYHSVEEDVND